MRPLTFLAAVALVVAACSAEPPAAPPSRSLWSSPTPSPASLSTMPAPTPSPSPASVSTTPIPTPTPPTPTAVNTTITGEVRWERLAEFPSLGAFDSFELGDRGSHVIGFDGGYIVTGGASGTVQYSADGVKWRQAKLKVPKGVALGVNAVTTNGSQVLAVGSYTLCKWDAWWERPGGRCRERPASWVTDDGRTWRSSAAWKGSVGWAGSAFYHVWSVPGAGFEAAQGWGTEDPDDESYMVVGRALWHSDDGRTWSLLRAQPADPSEECDPYWSADSFQALADASGRRYAIEYPGPWCGNDGGPFTEVPAGAFLSVSDDGRAYERIAAAPLIGGLDETLAPVGDGAWVSVGPGPVAELRMTS